MESQRDAFHVFLKRRNLRENFIGITRYKLSSSLELAVLFDVTQVDTILVNSQIIQNSKMATPR